MPDTAIQLGINSKVHDALKSTASFAYYRTGAVSAGWGYTQGQKKCESIHHLYLNTYEIFTY